MRESVQRKTEHDRAQDAADVWAVLGLFVRHQSEDDGYGYQSQPDVRVILLSFSTYLLHFLAFRSGTSSHASQTKRDYREVFLHLWGIVKKKRIPVNSNAFPPRAV